VRWLVLWLWVAVVGCGGGDAKVEAEGEAPEVERIPAPEVMFAGCYDIRDGICLRREGGPSSLVVWVDVPRHVELRGELDGAVVTPETESVDGGQRLRFSVPMSATSLRVDGVGPAWAEPWTLALEPYRFPKEAEAAIRVFAKGRRSEALEQLDDAIQGLRGEDRLIGIAELSWLAHQDAGRVVPEREQAVIELAREMGRSYPEARAIAKFLNMVLIPEGRLPEARRYVERLEELGEQIDEAKAWLAVRRAHFAVAAGDLGTALRGFEQSIVLASRLGLARSELSARLRLSALHAQLAHWPEVDAAVGELERLSKDSTLNCRDRRSALTGIGWRRLLQRRAGRPSAWPDPEFEAALATAEPGGECPSAWAVANSRINLALSQLQQGDPAGALVWLEPVQDVPADLEPWFREVRARAGLRLRRIEADLIPSPLRVIDARDPIDRWNAWVRQAELLEDMGSSAALEAWSEAESIVSQRATELALSTGRERFLAGQRASAEGLVAALVRAGRAEEAECRARLARSRSLRLLDLASALERSDPAARDAWLAGRAEFSRLRRQIAREEAKDREHALAVRERRRAQRVLQHAEAERALDDAAAALQRQRRESCEALPPLAPETSRVLAFPVRGHWLVFATDDRGTDVVRVDALAEGEVPDERFTALVERTEAAARIQVLPTGAAWNTPMAKWRWGEDHLLDVAPLEYALDLAPRQPQRRRKRAVVVADPSSDLAMARDEAEVAAESLATAGWTVEHLRGSEATQAGLTAALLGADLFHYAGHGESRGDAGWDAALILASDERLSVKDILALPSLPSIVLLSGCETGAAFPGTLEGGMNLGRAFVLAGASAALVADDKVPDALARDVGGAVYNGLSEEGWSLAAALRDVQLRVRGQGRAPQWADFRVVVP